MTQMHTHRPASRERRKLIYIGATIVSFAAFCAMIVAAPNHPVLPWMSLIPAAIGLVFACLWVASVDEAARQAHYIAWYWGGSAGLCVSILCLVATTLQPAFLEPLVRIASYSPETGVWISFTSGLLIGLVPASLGYVIWWAMVWLRRR